MAGLEGKRIIVAGGATGIGAATARLAAERGARVVVGDVNDEGAAKTVASIRSAGGDATAIHFDLAEEESVREFGAAAVAWLGGADGLANFGASAAMSLRDGDLFGMEVEVWQQTLRVNLIGYALTCREILPALIAAGGGSIVNCSSGAAVAGEPTRPAYAASKAGINALTRHIASRWGADNIRSNAISPGLILTEGVMNALPQEFMDQILATTPLPRHGRPADPASLVCFLLSDDATWITGQALHVNGGGDYHD